MECKEAFLTHGKNDGGKTFHYIPCLNERPDLISALTQLAIAHLGHWLHTPGRSDPTVAERAKALGAKQ